MRWKINIPVILLHMIAACAFTYSIDKKIKTPPQKMRIVMRSEAIAPRMQEKPIAVSHSIPESPAKPKIETPKKKVVVQPPPKKPIHKLAKKTAPPPKKPEKKPSKKLVTKAKKTTPKQPEKKFDIPLLHATLPKVEEEESSHFFEDICALFEEFLILPEKGSVKVTITVQANGHIGKIDFVASESERNLEYLKRTLPTVKLPIRVEGKDVVFTVTFCDD